MSPLRVSHGVAYGMVNGSCAFSRPRHVLRPELKVSAEGCSHNMQVKPGDKVTADVHDFAGVVIGAGHERLETYKFGSVDYFGLGDERQSENGNCGHEYAFHNPPPRATILTLIVKERPGPVNRDRRGMIESVFREGRLMLSA